MGEPILIDPADLDALIDKRIAERDAKAAEPRKGRTRGCNCAGEGYVERTYHQFGCPYGAKSPEVRTSWLKGEV